VKVNPASGVHMDFVGRLPKAFIAVAFSNFLVGAGLGGWMASRPEYWSLVGSIHGEINPFGWLTMLIYGMTYAVLSISTGLRPAKAWVGWAHLLLAELAVVVVTVAFLTQRIAVLQVGLACQFAAPVLFLANILSAVFAARRRRKGAAGEPVIPDTEQSQALAFLRRDPMHQAIDRVAQRGTDVALMLFVLGAGWMLLSTFGQQSPLADTEPEGALFIVYYGWIGGTILAVSLHLFPRFLAPAKFGVKTVAFGQAVWGLSVLLGAVGAVWSPTMARFGHRSLGLAFICFAGVYLKALLAHHKVSRRNVRLPKPSLVAWYASWTFCLVLGVFLICGINPLSLVALHLLFLAFATNLVYGVGYALFPLLLRRKPPSQTLAMAQVATAILGVLLMVVAFLGMSLVHLPGTLIMLAVGGILAAVSAMVFILQWPFSTSL